MQYNIFQTFAIHASCCVRLKKNIYIYFFVRIYCVQLHPKLQEEQSYLCLHSSSYSCYFSLMDYIILPWNINFKQKFFM